MYQDLSIHHDWPVKKAIVNLPIKLKENSKCTFGNLLSLLGAKKKYVCTALQTLNAHVLTGVKLSLRSRLDFQLLCYEHQIPMWLVKLK